MTSDRTPSSMILHVPSIIKPDIQLLLCIHFVHWNVHWFTFTAQDEGFPQGKLLRIGVMIQILAQICGMNAFMPPDDRSVGSSWRERKQSSLFQMGMFHDVP